MNSANYIAEFMKEHNNVVVPDFGEFFLKNAKAVIDEKTKSILPPAKEIGFAVDYQVKDQKLIDYISEKKGIPYSQAESDLRNLTDHWKRQLAENHQLSIENIGTFYQAENDAKFKGVRIGKASPDFYGLEEIDLQNIKTPSTGEAYKKEYQLNSSILWLFLLVLPVLGLVFLAFTQRERIFGKKSFDDFSVKTSMHRIEADSTKMEEAELQRLKIDSIKKDSVNNGMAPIHGRTANKYTTKKYNSKKWSISKKQANR